MRNPFRKRKAPEPSISTPIPRYAYVPHRHEPVPELDLEHETVGLNIGRTTITWRWCKCGAVNNGFWGWQHAETRELILERIEKDRKWNDAHPT